MSLFTKNTNKQNQQNQSAQNQTSPKENTVSGDKQEKNLLQTLSQCLPFLPLLFEQFTGQKIPQVQGTIAEMHTLLSQIQQNQQKILTNQQEIASHIQNLEANASNELSNLGQQMQVLKDTAIKLTHEKKEIEFKPAQNQLSELKN